MNKNIIDAYQELRSIIINSLMPKHYCSYAEEDNLPDEYAEKKTSVAQFIDVLTIESKNVTDKNSLLDFLRITAEQGKNIPDEYRTLKSIVRIAEEAVHSEHPEIFLEKTRKNNVIINSFFTSLEKPNKEFSAFQNMSVVNYFLETFSVLPVFVPKEICMTDCLKMVEVVKDFYHECLEKKNYADFTTFFAIYCTQYILSGLICQLEWSDEFMFGIEKSMFIHADKRLLPYLEKIYKGILSAYQKSSWYDFTKFYANNYEAKRYIKDRILDYNIDEILSMLEMDDLEEFTIFKSAAEIWSELPIANYYCFIRMTKFYFDFYYCKEIILQEIREEIIFLKEEIDAIQHDLEKISEEDRNYLHYKEKLKYYKEKADNYIFKHDILIQKFDDYNKMNEEERNLINFYKLLPKEYRQYAVNSPKHEALASNDQIEEKTSVFPDYRMLPAIHIGKDNYYINRNDVYLLAELKTSTTFGRQNRLGMSISIQYPDILMELLLDDKQKLAEQNQELKKAQEDRAKVINEFSHTYKNMRATSLLEVANALMATGDPDMIMHGRTVLLEYGVKQTLTKDIEMLQLRFEDEIEKLQNKIRKSMQPEKTEKSKSLHQLLSDAFKRCLITTVHDTDERMDAMRWGFSGFRIDLPILCERFENEILFVPNGNVFEWFSKEIIPISCKISSSWKELHFLENSYAALMVTDLIAELTANMFKYADKSKSISYSFTERDDRLLITIQNYTAPHIEKSADGGVGLISKSETLKLLNEAGKLDEEAITTNETKEGIFTTTVVLSKQVFACLPEENEEESE